MSSNIVEKDVHFDFLDDDFKLVGEENLAHVDKIYASQPYWKDVLTRFIKNKGAMIGLVFIILITIMAVVGIHLNGHTYDSQVIAHQNLAPRVPGLEKIGIMDGSETMNTTAGPCLLYTSRVRKKRITV